MRPHTVTVDLTRVDFGEHHHTVSTTFADMVDATAFIHAQARAATAAGDRTFEATTRIEKQPPTTVRAEGVDIAGSVQAAFCDNNGHAELAVAGIDARVVAQRSPINQGALLITVDADRGQRIVFAINDDGIADTVVGAGRGQIVVTREDQHNAGRPTISCSLPQALTTNEILEKLRAVIAGHAIDFSVHYNTTNNTAEPAA